MITKKTPANRSAVQLKTFVTRLIEAGVQPASIELRPDGTLVANFGVSDHAGLHLEHRMQDMMG